MASSERSTLGQWSTEQIGGHRCRLFEPAQMSPHGEVLLYLHGCDGEDPSDYPALTEQFSLHGLRVVAPQTGPSWWSDRRCAAFDAEQSAEEYLLHEVLGWLTTAWQAKPSSEPLRVALLGISMGGQGALRLAYKYPTRFPVVAAVAPAMDYHLWWDPQPLQPEITSQVRALYRNAEDARQDSALLHIHPLNWPRHQFFCCDPNDHWHESADRLRMKLSSLGIPHECDLATEAGGHSWDYFSAMMPRTVQFLVDRLEQERRRVV